MTIEEAASIYKHTVHAPKMLWFRRQESRPLGHANDDRQHLGADLFTPWQIDGIGDLDDIVAKIEKRRRKMRGNSVVVFSARIHGSVNVKKLEDRKELDPCLEMPRENISPVEMFFPLPTKSNQN